MIIQPQPKLIQDMLFSTITVKLVMPKTKKKDKIGDQKNLLANFIFLKVISNIRDVFDANHFTL